MESFPADFKKIREIYLKYYSKAEAKDITYKEAFYEIQEELEKLLEKEAHGSVYKNEETKEIKRHCPICENEINKLDFQATNLGRNIYMCKGNMDKVWEEPRITIPCCQCFKLLKKINSIQFENYPKKQLIQLIYVHFNSIKYDYITIVKNLKKFGIMDARNYDLDIIRNDYIKNNRKI